VSPWGVQHCSGWPEHAVQGFALELQPKQGHCQIRYLIALIIVLLLLKQMHEPVLS
jgi:hypothetical protein